MAKVAKSPMFVKPTKEEVINFIDLTMRDWPRSYCEIIGETFFEFYQSVGWRLSKNIPMKDWQAAWNGRWKNNLKPSDKRLLEEHLRMPANRIAAAERRRQADGMFADQFEPTVGSAKPASYYLEFYENMRQSFFAGQLTEKQLRPHYDKLKALGVMRLPKSQIEAIYVEMGNDRDRGKGLSIQQLFLNLQHAGMTLQQFYAHQEKQQQS